jgi:hypothetical protein
VKHVSALLTLLLAALLAEPLPRMEGGGGPTQAAALVELETAQGAASLKGKQSARDGTSQDAGDDGDTDDTAILSPFARRSDGGSVGTTRPASPGTSILAAPRAYEARAPPTL